MAKRITYEEVRDLFDSYGAKLLTPKNEYKNTQQILSFLCHCGRVGEIRYYNFKRYKHCSECSSELRGEKIRKYTYEDICDYFKKYNCILLTEFDKSIISTSDIIYKCSCGNIEKTKFVQFMKRKEKKCLKCLNQIKTPYNEVYNLFDKSGCKLLTSEEEYINNLTGYNLKYKCSCGNISTIDLYSFKTGTRCRNCMGEKLRIIKATPYNDVKEYIESFEGYKLLSTEYINCDTALEIKCPEDHIFNMDFYHFKNRGQRCSVCNSLRDRSGENSNTWKGGLTSLNQMLRSNLKEWKFKSLEKHNFQCVITGNKRNLHVHHIIPFNVVIAEVLNELNIPNEKLVKDYTDEEVNNIKIMIDDYHSKNLGVPITKKYHKLFHSIYGFNANEKDWIAFINDYKEGNLNIAL